MNYEELKQSLPYRALLGLRVPLTDEDFVKLRDDPRVYCAAWNVNRPMLEKAYGAEAAAIYARSSTRRSLGETFYKALVKPDELTAADLPAIESDDTTLIAIVRGKQQQAFRLLGEKYALPTALVEYLMEQDLKAIVGVLLGGGRSSRFETYAERAINRLKIHHKNFRAIEGITTKYGLRRHAFFDVGCLFGLSMVSAQTLGYTRAHGCELDTKVFARARWITEWMNSNRPGDVAYYDQDFTKLELPAREYTLIMINNVLEHTPHLEETIAQLGRVLADDGMAYIYQGNYKSISFVRSEPHYRLPFLTILPKELVVQILIRMNRIASPEQYVVTRWPDHDELQTMFSSHGLTATFHAESLGYWSAVEPVPPSRLAALRKLLWADAEEKLFGVLTPSERKQVEQIGDAYFREVEASLSRDPVGGRIRYLKTTWDITAQRSAHAGQTTR